MSEALAVQEIFNSLGRGSKLNEIIKETSK
jgi:hypothetical protein